MLRHARKIDLPADVGRVPAHIRKVAGELLLVAAAHRRELHAGQL
jgi:hypothetical protein